MGFLLKSQQLCGPPYYSNFCGIGLEHRALQSPTRRATVSNQDTMKRRVETRGEVSHVAISKRGRGEFIILPYVISSLSLRTSN